MDIDIFEIKRNFYNSDVPEEFEKYISKYSVKYPKLKESSV